MKKLLFVLSVSLLAVCSVNAQSQKKPTQPYRKASLVCSVDTAEVAAPVPVERVCFRRTVPTFPGDLIKFFRSKLLWPGGSENKNIEGTVVVNFYIDSDGTCSEFKVVRSLNPDFNVEVLRVLMQMPKWIVNSKTKEGAWFTMPITFKK